MGIFNKCILLGGGVVGGAEGEGEVTLWSLLASGSCNFEALF